MNKKSLKAFTILVSTLTMASTSAGIISITNSSAISVQAAKKHHKKHAKKHTKKHTKMTASIKAGHWFNKHAKNLYAKFNNQGTFSLGQSDGSTYQKMTLQNYQDPQYREGWIIAYANGKDRNNTPDPNYGGTIQGYAQAYNVYMQGVKFIQTSHPNYNPKIINNTWSTNYPRTIDDDNF